jgi:hypothetical protein
MALIKTVTIETTGNSLTVTITDGPNYPAATAQVTVIPFTMGVVVPPPQDDHGSPMRTLVFAPLKNGDYAVTVVCSGKTDGTLVTIPSENHAEVVLDETNFGVWLGEHP